MRLSRHVVFSLLSAHVDPGNALIPVKRAVQSLQANSSAPVVVSPSKRWEGVDGPWSTFQVEVGNAQSVRLLPSIGSSLTWVIGSTYRCDTEISNNCTDVHGGVFDQTQSNTWKPLGNESLPFNPFSDGTVQAEVGLDTMIFPGSGLEPVTVEQSLIATVSGDVIWLGSLGLNPRPMNFSGTTPSPQAGLVQKMKTQGLIPSLSWAYTAGAKYRNSSLYGSLTIGGYDNARRTIPTGTDPQLTFPMNQANDRDLVVGISSVTASGTLTSATETDLVNVQNAVFARIDSATQYLRMPTSICQAFQLAFGLTWNAQQDLYVLNMTQHQKLLDLDAKVTFTLTPTLPPSATNNTVSITLPYAAFALNDSRPYASNETLYFPLQIAMNGSQVSLGRAFLQEAYVVADYERNNFSVWPVNWNWTEQKAQIIPISSTGRNLDPEREKSTLSKAGIVGIAVGASVFLIFVIVACFFFYRHRHQSHIDPALPKELPCDTPNYELHEDHRFEVAEGGKFEMDGSGRPHEADSHPAIYEMDAGSDGVQGPPLSQSSDKKQLLPDPASPSTTDRNNSISTEKSLQKPTEQHEPAELPVNPRPAMSFAEFFKRTPDSDR